ncbi:chaperone modulator CbpM [Roseomonas sp. NAR14]|uniref:Chaperone modulator CbpM n=1 Tax=Roseomonas acroporae TaxID=2937791 RepID=A0A9X1YFA0_9PROT|nr:chaperone modulator CbpM [Roseomonas acroporae]MCK8787592.1 chaperone modulator CbpM [Roseomonas acroporae]
MIALEALLRLVAGLRASEIEGWIAQGWVRPSRGADGFAFSEIDVARVRLIVELRDEMEVGEEAMPVVLSLLDRLYAERRRMRRLCEAIERAGVAERLRAEVLPD